MKTHLRRTRVTWLAYCAAIAAVLFLPAAQAAPGDLDSGFGSGGKVLTDFGASDRAFGVVVQRDGMIVVAGGSAPGSPQLPEFAIARYNANGSLDAGFGSGGKVRTDFGYFGFAYGVALQSDGKIVAAGQGLIPGISTTDDFALARYNADGSLDPTFGGSGMVVTNLLSHELARGVAIQPDGKIVAVGQTRANPSGGDSDFAVVRYNPNGTLDTTFAGGGRVITSFTSVGDGAGAVVIQPDAKILVVGAGNNGPQTTPGFAVARYNPDGSLDASFDGDGKVLSDFGAGSSVALQPDGKILVAGGALARYNANGSLDTSFGTNGKLVPTTYYPRQVLLQPDRDIVVVGTVWNTPPRQNGDFTVVRLRPSGAEDARFGSAGHVVTDIGSNSDDYPETAALQSDRRIVVAGGTRSVVNGPMDFAVVRYLNPAPRVCRVPNVRGKTLRAARSKLRKARCKVGKVRRRPSSTIRRGRVISQSPRPGSTLPNGGKVNLVLSRG
jgi:uncharacterized delta-60 repeat protein